MKKVLIFYASYGGGHLSAANSIKQCIEEYYPDYETKLVDCMLYVNKPINKITTTAYKEMAKKFPWVWGEVYNQSQRGPLAKISSTSNNILAKKLLTLVKEYEPDIIISTHPFSSQMISYLKRKKLVDCTLATIMTDFSPHDQWLVGKYYVDFFFVSNNKLRDYLISSGISEEKVFATGIPLSNRFLMHYNKSEIKLSFDLDLSKKVILFFGGGEFGLGREKTVKILSSFIDHADKYQIVAIAGKNEKMKAEFDKLVEHKNAESIVKVLPYTTKVPELMSISDLVVTKPGGLTTTESLASGLPIIAINPIPGQEEENAQFLEDSGVAIWIRKDDNYDAIISDILKHPTKLRQMKVNTKILAKKHSTKDICDIVLGNKIKINKM